MGRTEVYENQAFDGDAQDDDRKLVKNTSIQQVENKIDFDTDEHKVPLNTLLDHYGTNRTTGLTEEQVSINRQRFGRNLLTPPEKPSAIGMFVKEVFAGLNALLWLCGFMSLSLYLSQYASIREPKDIDSDNLTDFLAIVIIVHVSGGFSFYQRFKSNRIMESFKNLVPRKTTVIREGHLLELEVEDIVVGDIVKVKYGDVIPADLRILKSNNFKVDNSSLTGESEPQRRCSGVTHDDPMETRNLAFFSTTAAEGSCTGVVIRTGPNTVMGQLITAASTLKGGKTPLGVELKRFVKIMGWLSIIIGSSFCVLAMVLGFGVKNSLYCFVGMVIANVPDGLATTFTMSLSVASHRMAKKNCLVKHLHAVEALGSTSVICSDKTGTLTQNKMAVSHLWFDGRIVSQRDLSRTNLPGLRELANVGMLCSRAKFKAGQENIPGWNRVVEGDPSESAIFTFMEHRFGNVEEYRETYPKVGEIPFNSVNKFQVSLHEDTWKPSNSNYLLTMKGAAESIIKMCTTILIGAQEYDLDDHWREEFSNAYQDLGSYGERVLGFCDGKLPKQSEGGFSIGERELQMEDITSLNIGFRFVGLISLVDPPRVGVPEAVARCRSAGIKVVMVTGDHPVTANAIARAVGIISEGNNTNPNPTKIESAVVSGSELSLLSSEDLHSVIQRHEELVFARTSPEQKHRIVEAFQDLGFVVAATGDGVNDSSALKKADIGIAMGMAGSEVSKETADMILMDDNFATIVTGVEEGRRIFDNLKKLLAYQLADNVAEMYCVMVFIILGIPMPMGNTAMLLVTCGTDLAPAITISYERAEHDILKQKPRNPRTDTLVTPSMLSYCYGQAAFIEVFAGFFAYFVCLMCHGWMPWSVLWIQRSWDSKGINDLEDDYGQEWSHNARQELALRSQTAFFIAIVLTQIANVIISKRRRLSIFHQGLNNWRMNVAIPFSLCLACAMIYTPTLNSYLGLRSVNPWIWLSPVPFMLYFIVYDEIRRVWIRHGEGWLQSEWLY